MLFSLRMAWAYFRKIWSRGILGIMVGISIIGVALGVASLVITLSVMNGFHTEITAKLLSLNPHIIMINPYAGDDIKDSVKKVLDGNRYIKSYSAFIYGKGLLQHRKNSQGIVVKGIVPGTSQLRLSEGKWNELSDNNIVIGKEVSRALYLDKGAELYLIIPRVENIGIPIVPRVEKFIVSGIFNSGMYEYDSGLVFVNKKKALDLFADNSSSSGLELYLDQPFAAEKVSKLLREKLESSFRISTWKDRNSNLFAALKLEKTMMFIVLVMIILVATFNIAGSLMMLTITRSRDCGIMRAIGATKRQIGMIFSIKGLMIGFFGTGIGVGAGIVLAYLLGKYEFIKLPPQVYLISTLPVRVDLQDIGLIVLTALLISFLATIYPSYRAGHLEVAEELRYE
ncbi:FtsX-like permease family protein [Elusimicrobiota bacterium]